jgi:hypothetical protein
MDDTKKLELARDYLWKNHPDYSLGSAVNRAMRELKEFEKYKLSRMSRKADPQTSKDAAKKVELKEKQKQVLAAFRNAGSDGLTTSELDDLFRPEWGNTSTARTRRKELADLGHIKETEATRTNRRGNAEIVWVIK